MCDFCHADYIGGTAASIASFLLRRNADECQLEEFGTVELNGKMGVTCAWNMMPSPSMIQNQSSFAHVAHSCQKSESECHIVVFRIKMPPFQAERPERSNATVRLRDAPVLQTPFGEEGDEACSKQRTLKKRKAPEKPFGVEGSSDGDEPQEPSEHESNASCSLGWDTLAAFAKSTAWSRQSLELKSEKKQENIWQQPTFQKCKRCENKSKHCWKWLWFCTSEQAADIWLWMCLVGVTGGFWI